MSLRVVNSDQLENTTLIIKDSNVPIIRAGIANGYFFFLAVLIFFFTAMHKQGSTSIIGYSLLFIVFLYITYSYVTSISKAFFYPDRIVIQTSIATKTINIESIKKIKLAYAPLNYMITIKFSLKDQLFPSAYGCVIWEKTNFGTYRQTLNKIENILIGYGKPFGKSTDLIKVFKRLLGKHPDNSRS